MRLEYRPIERTTVVTRHDGGKWVYQYNEVGTIMHVPDPYNGMQSYVLDDTGRVREEVDPLGNRYSYSKKSDFPLARKRIRGSSTSRSL